MRVCITKEMREYIAYHLDVDEENHEVMTTNGYREAHPENWSFIGWENWVQMQKKQAESSREAARWVKELSVCRKGE